MKARLFRNPTVLMVILWDCHTDTTAKMSNVYMQRLLPTPPQSYKNRIDQLDPNETNDCLCSADIIMLNMKTYTKHPVSFNNIKLKMEKKKNTSGLPLLLSRRGRAVGGGRLRRRRAFRVWVSGGLTASCAAATTTSRISPPFYLITVALLSVVPVLPIDWPSD